MHMLYAEGCGFLMSGGLMDLRPEFTEDWRIARTIGPNHAKQIAREISFYKRTMVSVLNSPVDCFGVLYVCPFGFLSERYGFAPSVEKADRFLLSARAWLEIPAVKNLSWGSGVSDAILSPCGTFVNGVQTR